MVRFIIIRHGCSLGNREKRFSGQEDFPLTEEGVAQARVTARYVLDHFRVDKVYASDLDRAMETVRPIADALGEKVIPCPQLREVDVGCWQGMYMEDIVRQFPEEFWEYKENPGLIRFPNGESYADVQLRAGRAMDRIARENDGKTVVVGTHGGVIRNLYSVWKPLPLLRIKEAPRILNCSVTEVEYERGNYRILRFADSSHLHAYAKETEVD